LYMFGLVGGIIAIPIAGTIRVLLDEYFTHAKKQRALSEKATKS
jgi:predicted PurR-regulated permease PerM